MQKNVPFRLECDLSFVSLFFLPFILVVECYFLHFVQLCASTPFHGACWGWLVYGISSSMLPSSVSTAAFSFFASFIFLVLCVLPLLSLFLCFQAPNVPPPLLCSLFTSQLKNLLLLSLLWVLSPRRKPLFPTKHYNDQFLPLTALCFSGHHTV